jgi:peptidoglycan/LPS O-acetylase OafA/YrhL
MLSGSVIAYAYDNRWSVLTVKGLLRARLIRLYPPVLLTVVLGAFGYWFDPFVGTVQRVSGLYISVVLAFEALLLPFPSLPNHWEATHSIK